MKLVSLAKLALIAIVPLLLTLLVLNFTIFQEGFYEEKFSEYGVSENVENPIPMHQKVVDFIRSDSDSLPEDFNQRERSHLRDVRGVVSYLTIFLYVLIAIFIFLIVLSVIILKVNNSVTNFVGKVMIFGGILTIALSVILFFLISSDFGSFFDSFHRMFFAEGTYLFDPSRETIVRLYPANLFMDLGIRISRNVMIASALIAAAGGYLLFRSKRKS
jgi:integral membrane protein (TIGR01906 family)